MLGFLFDSLFVEQTDIGFNSQREESEFGLYDYKARYYSPLLGRFISADSIVPDFSNPQALNRYAYVYNNPLNYIDPSGHDPWWLQEPWYEDPVPNQPKTDSMGIDKQQLRVRLFMSNSVCCERQANAGTHKERIDQSIKAVTPKEWHDELDEINAFLDEWYPVLDFGLSIATMTSGGPPSRLPAREIRWTQKGISQSTKGGLPLDDLANDIGANGFQDSLEVVRHQGEFWALNNRRLTAAKLVDVDVPVTILDMKNPAVRASWRSHYDGGNGLSIRIRGTGMRVTMRGGLIE